MRSVRVDGREAGSVDPIPQHESTVQVNNKPFAEEPDNCLAVELVTIKLRGVGSEKPFHLSHLSSSTS